MKTITSKVEYVAVSSLKLHPQNPRTINRDQFKVLCQSIKDNSAYFEARPVLANREMFVFAGNMRLRSAIELGLTEVPCIVMDITPEKEKELMIRDNIQNGEWQIEILANNYDVAELSGYGLDVMNILGEEVKPSDIDDKKMPEIPKTPVSKLGELYQLGKHRVLCGDSTRTEDVQRLMKGQKAKMTFTDPPWNVAIGGDNNPRHRQREGLKNDKLSPDDFRNFLDGFSRNMHEVCEGDIYCVLGASEWPTLDLSLRSAGYHWSATIIWAKDQFVLGRSNYHRRYEPIWYGWPEKEKSTFNGERDLDDVWEIPRPKVSEEHPTMKPVELVQRAIINSSKEGDIVYEPFLGSGTTLLAAETQSRACYGIELDPQYVDVIIKRWEEQTGQKAILLEGEN